MKVNFTFSLGKEMREEARQAAKAYDMTLAQMMRRLLKDSLRRYREELRQHEEKTGALEKARLEAIKAMIANELKGNDE